MPNGQPGRVKGAPICVAYVKGISNARELMSTQGNAAYKSLSGGQERFISS